MVRESGREREDGEGKGGERVGGTPSSYVALLAEASSGGVRVRFSVCLFMLRVRA